MSDKYQGIKFPKRYGTEGPVETRKFTQIFWCIGLVIYIAIMVVAVYLHMSTANIDDVLSVMDSGGNLCGEGDFADYGYLFFFNFDIPYSSVCVKSCPTFDYNQIRSNSTGTSTTPLESMSYEEFRTKFADCKKNSKK